MPETAASTRRGEDKEKIEVETRSDEARGAPLTLPA